MPVKQSIVTTDAVVLRAMDYGESSCIATLFTFEHGKISVLARGSRMPKSKFGSTLEPLSYIQAVIYLKPTRGLQTISDATFIRSFPVTRESIERIEIGLRIMELTNAVMLDLQHHAGVFTLLVSALTALGTTSDEVRNILPFYQLRLASLLGFAPGFKKKEIEGLGTSHGVLELQTGRILEDGCAGFRSERSVLRAFTILARASLSTVLHMELSKTERFQLNELVSMYLQFHFEEAYPSRSERIFAQLGTGYP